MTPREAAALIGCSPRHVKVLCNKGILKSRRHKMPGGFYYRVDAESALEYSQAPQRQGWQRGKKRTAWQKVHDETKQLFEKE